MATDAKVMRDVFLRKCVEGVAARAPRFNKRLQDACKTLLDTLASGGPVSPQDAFLPFYLACATEKAKVVVVGLDGIQKLLLMGYLTDGHEQSMMSLDGLPSMGDSLMPDASDDKEAGEEARRSRHLIDQVVDTICRCHRGESTDEEVELQILKALLTAVTTPSSGVHGHSLLQAIRMCYMICLTSKSVINQTTARGLLDQMITGVFTKLEQSERGLKTPVLPAPLGDSADSSSTSLMASHLSLPDAQLSDDTLDGALQDGASQGAASHDGAHDDLSSPAAHQQGPTEGDSEQAKVAQVDVAEGPPGEAPLDETQAVEKEEAQSTPFDEPAPSPAPEMPEVPQDVSEPTPFDEQPSEEPSGAVDAPTTEVQATQFDEASADAVPDVAASPAPAAANAFDNDHSDDEAEAKAASAEAASRLEKAPSAGPTDEELQARASLAQRDAYLVLRTLCKLSRKSNTFAVSDQERQRLVNHRSKVVALELILMVLQNAGPMFQQGELFISAIKKYLIISLCSNALYASITIYELTLKIFLVLLTRFPAGLKYEIEVCINEIFLRILTSKNSTIHKKSMLLDYLVRICAVPQTLMDIFLNYDCDPESLESNLFERLINEMSKLAQITLAAPASPEAGVAPELYELKMKGLECLAAVLQSLVTWSIGINEGGKTAQESERVEDDAGHDNPAEFAQNKLIKQVMLDGVKLFNTKPKKGIRYLVDNGAVGSSPADVAAFLLNTPGLDKTCIGDYLGEADEENVQTMHAFVDAMQFANMEFVEALRAFLQAFRLPGEAQKIDRFMLKFAERYVKDNPGTFANADTAYVLAYSVIMLNVDQHNRQVKRRMTKVDFIKNNRGINDNADLPDDFLGAIYDDIHNNEIKMKDEQAKMESRVNAELLSTKDRRTAYLLESKEILRRTQALFSEEKKRHTTFVHATRVEHVKPMFEAAWLPIFASISGPLQDSEDVDMVSLCLRAFTHAVHISCIFFMDLQRDAFISTLVKFTNLTSLRDARPPQLRQKHFEAVRAVLDVAYMDGNYLKSSWTDVLHCFSALHRLQVLNEGAAEQQPLRSSSTSSTSSSGRRREAKPSMSDVDAVAEARSQNMVIATDKIFANSVQLDGDAIVDFVRSLISVSSEEIELAADSERPRLYSLERLVEISYYNMNRIRLEWSRIWAMLGEHFNQVGCNSNHLIAAFAVDSLRQLATKFLEKGELAYFQFQKDFMAPFVHIITNNPSSAIRDIVIRCIIQMLQARSQSIRSGWRVVLQVLVHAPTHDNVALANEAFECTRAIIARDIDNIVAQNSFGSLVQVLVAFARIRDQHKIALHAIGLFRELHARANELSAAQGELSGPAPSVDDAQARRAEQQQTFRPAIYLGIQSVILHTELEVRTRALGLLFELLHEDGVQFSHGFWEQCYRDVLVPLFADMFEDEVNERRGDSPVDIVEWVDTTGVASMRYAVELLGHFFEATRFLLPDLLQLLKKCVANETVAKIGCKALESFVASTCARYSPDEWSLVSRTVVALLDEQLPRALQDHAWVEADLKAAAGVSGSAADVPPPVPARAEEAYARGDSIDAVERFEAELARHDRLMDDAHSLRSVTLDVYESTRPAEVQPSAEFRAVVRKALRELVVLAMVRDMLDNPAVFGALEPQIAYEIVAAVEASHAFARAFDRSNAALRANLQTVGLLGHLPDLLKQETLSAQVLLASLHRMCIDERPSYRAIREQSEQRLAAAATSVLSTFDELSGARRAKDAAAYTRVVAILLGQLQQCDDELFRARLKDLYTGAVALLRHPLTQAVRSAVVEVFSRVGTVYGVV